MEDLIESKFFEFYPQKLYTEIYSVGYNEFLKAVGILRETLVQKFPEKEKEIELSCGKMLEAYSHDFDKKWFSSFLVYCSKNIFSVNERVPVYKPEMDAVEANKDAHEKSQSLRHCIMATEYLNIQLLGKLKELDAEIATRKELLLELMQTEEKLALVRRAKELNKRLDSVEQLQEV